MKVQQGENVIERAVKGKVVKGSVEVCDTVGKSYEVIGTKAKRLV